MILKVFYLLLLGVTLIYGDSPKTAASNVSRTTRCPLPYQEVGSRCLYFAITEAGIWSDMEYLCTQFEDGHLAIIDDANLLEDVADFIIGNGFSHTEYWLGATDVIVEDIWLWVDGTDVKRGTPYWALTTAGQQPDGGTGENCLAITQANQYFFSDEYCGTDMIPICEY